MTVQLWHGDCLELMKDIPDHSIDAIICDLPYGTTACKWDSVISFEPLWEQYKRVIKPKGAIVLFGSQPFTSNLIMSNIKWFKDELIWHKTQATGHLNCKIQPMNEHENIIIFGNGKITYNPLIEPKNPLNIRPISRYASSPVYGEFNEKATRTIPKDMQYPRSVIEFSNTNHGERGLHPTQKPIALLEYLVKTYSNEGETVLDNCMGSGTTGVACINTNRNFIGIEKDFNYFQVALERINTIQNLPITKTSQTAGLIIKQFSMFDSEGKSA